MVDSSQQKLSPLERIVIKAGAVFSKTLLKNIFRNPHACSELAH